MQITLISFLMWLMYVSLKDIKYLKVTDKQLLFGFILTVIIIFQNNHYLKPVIFGIVVFVIYFLLINFTFLKLGGADVKILFIVSMFFGSFSLDLIISFFIIMHLVALIYSVLILIFKGKSFKFAFVPIIFISSLFISCLV